MAATAQDGRDVVVFDTLGKLARVRDENSAPDWSAAMTPLQDLATSGRAVFVLRHDRKGGGDVGESGRGSSQASGDVTRPVTPAGLPCEVGSRPDCR